jgi:hypothetical protein
MDGIGILGREMPGRSRRWERSFRSRYQLPVAEQSEKKTPDPRPEDLTELAPDLEADELVVRDDRGLHPRELEL